MRIEAKEAVSKWLKNVMKGSAYEGIEISGANSETKTYPRLSVSILRENPITNEYSGLIGFDVLTGRKKILYISDFTMGISVITEIDDESSSIAEIMVDSIREKRVDIESEKIDIVKVYDQIFVGEPVKLKAGSLGAFSTTVSFDMRVKE